MRDSNIFHIGHNTINLLRLKSCIKADIMIHESDKLPRLDERTRIMPYNALEDKYKDVMGFMG